MRAALVIAQVTIAFALLAGSGLALRAFAKTAATHASTPAGSSFVTLDEDGTQARSQVGHAFSRSVQSLSSAATGGMVTGRYIAGLW